jgi:hypothetical protein
MECTALHHCLLYCRPLTTVVTACSQNVTDLDFVVAGGKFAEWLASRGGHENHALFKSIAAACGMSS